MDLESQYQLFLSPNLSGKAKWLAILEVKKFAGEGASNLAKKQNDAKPVASVSIPPEALLYEVQDFSELVSKLAPIDQNLLVQSGNLQFTAKEFADYMNSRTPTTLADFR